MRGLEKWQAVAHSLAASLDVPKPRLDKATGVVTDAESETR